MNNRFICDLPWVHLSVMPHGVSSVCCVADHSNPMSRARSEYKQINAATSTVDDIINSDTYKQIRLDMLAGKVPAACSTCKKVEDVGGLSKRLRDGSKLKLDYDALTDDTGKIAMDLRNVELRLGNYCNLKCRSCNAESSTSWIQDYNKLKNIVKLPSSYDSVLANPSSDYSWCEKDEFYDRVIAASPNLHEMHISGGEPFLVPKHFNLLHKLIDMGKTDVFIHYVTNLNYNFDKLLPALELLKQFKYVSISFSIDDVTERNSYIRKLSDWELTVSNLKKFLTEYPQLHYSVTQTVSVLNFLTIEELYYYLIKHNCMPRYGVRVNHVHAPEYLSPLVLPMSVRQQKIDSLVSMLPPEMVDNLRGRYYFAPQNDLLCEFKQVTAAIDDVRNEDFKKIFPRLNNLL